MTGFFHLGPSTPMFAFFLYDPFIISIGATGGGGLTRGLRCDDKYFQDKEGTRKFHDDLFDK